MAAHLRVIGCLICGPATSSANCSRIKRQLMPCSFTGVNPAAVSGRRWKSYTGIQARGVATERPQSKSRKRAHFPENKKYVETADLAVETGPTLPATSCIDNAAKALGGNFTWKNSSSIVVLVTSYISDNKRLRLDMTSFGMHLATSTRVLGNA